MSTWHPLSFFCSRCNADLEIKLICFNAEGVLQVISRCPTPNCPVIMQNDEVIVDLLAQYAVMRDEQDEVLKQYEKEMRFISPREFSDGTKPEEKSDV